MALFFRLITLCAATAAAMVGFGAGNTIAADQQFISVGTGSVTGVYYPAGGAICQLMNKKRAEHGMRCAVEATSGSVYNINTIRNGELDFGIAQSDAQHNALHAKGEFADSEAFEDIRAVFSLHSEPFTVVARKNSDITTFDDLKGKRVNIGNSGSSQRALMETLIEAKGWTMDDFAIASELKASQQAQALCDSNIDVIIYIIGHPSSAIQKTTALCSAKLVEVASKEVQTLIANTPYYRDVTLTGGMYKGNETDVRTFGVAATLVTSASVSKDIVYELVKSVFEDFETFKNLHPAFANLDKEDMISKALSAPLHEGAVKYYREKGWM